MTNRRRNILTAMGIALAGLTALIVANYQTTIVLAAVVASSLSYHPPITRNLHEWGKAEFTARLNRQFPVGTPRTALTSALRKQRFKIDDQARKAVFHGEWLPCNITYEVHWSTDASDRLSSVEGDQIEAGCL